MVTVKDGDRRLLRHDHLHHFPKAEMRLATTTKAASRMNRALAVSMLLFICSAFLAAQAQPVIGGRSAGKVEQKRSAAPTPMPWVLTLNPRSTPDEVYAFYSPRDVNTFEHGTPVKRQDQPSVPLSSLGPPSFPSSIPSCPKCESQYSSLSSCMGASSAFANATSIFNNPIAYINAIKCACTDTFQSVYPQCLDCFQRTDQCYYLGTDSQGTGAGNVISNMRSICGLGSALLGGVASANGDLGTDVPSNPGTYTDVSTTAAGYKDASTGAIFQSSGGRSSLDDAVRGLKLGGMMVVLTGLAVMGGAMKIAL